MTLKSYLDILPRLVRYNLQIIFANKFIWFLLTALVFFGYFMYRTAYQADDINEGTVYGIMLLPAFLLVFYPAVFGIQNDEDNRILEILFGIPNYRYKVWMVRLLIIYVAVFVILVLFGYIAVFMLYPINPFEMAFQLMFPVLFLGNLAFLISTLTRSGNGTAVLIIIVGVALLILPMFGQFGWTYSRSMWFPYLNPFELPGYTHPMIWDATILKNRGFLLAGAVIWMMLGLLSLQKREKFV